MLAHLADVSIRSVLLVLIAAIVLWTLRAKRTAALQHAVWTVVMCGMLALFAFGSALPRLPLRVLDRPAAAPLHSPPPLRYAPLVGETVELSAPPPATPTRRIDWRSIALSAYAVIAFAFLARFATGMFLVRKLLMTSIDVGGFRESATIAVPLTIGVTRPQILLPLEWRDWDREKLDAVLAHEGSHARRRDGLVAALAGINRCVFWFHPLAWLLERRLRLLAELACDESCVAALGDRERYARLLLDMASVVDGAHGRLQSHALTMAASSHIRQRIDSILKEQHPPSRGLTWTGWAAVALCGIPVVLGAGTLELAAPLPPLPPPGWGFTAPAPPPPRLLARARSTAPAPGPATRLEFEVASVRPSGLGRIGLGMNGGPGTSDPGRLNYVNVPLYRILTKAYRMTPYEVVGPSWMNDSKYDITATIPDGTTAEQLAVMLQNLLTERFHLTMHRETRDQTFYNLTIGRSGSKLKESDLGAPQAQIPDGPIRGDNDGFPVPFPGRSMVMRFSTGKGSLRMSGGLQTTEQIAQMLTNYVGARVVNKTGLTGEYDFHLEFAGDDSADGTGGLVPPPVSASDPLPSIFSAVQDYLGLRLDKSKGALDVFVIDRLDRNPTGN